MEPEESRKFTDYKPGDSRDLASSKQQPKSLSLNSSHREKKHDRSLRAQAEKQESDSIDNRQCAE